MPLQLCQHTIDLKGLHEWVVQRELMNREFDEGYALHAFMTENLGDLAPRPYRLMHTRGAPKATLYGYSKYSAEEINQAAQDFSEPSFTTICSVALAKTMPCTWKEGRILGFDIKLRPIKRGKDESGRTFERDAFLSLIHSIDPAQKIIRKDVYAKWLDERLKNNGAKLINHDKVRMPHFQRSKIVRKRNSKGDSEGPECVLQGDLEITDESAFNQLLASGIGRHRAYGFGMLLLKPASLVR